MDEASVRDRVERAAEDADRLDPVLGTFVCRLTDQAREAADSLDRLSAAGGVTGPLHGMLIGVKDSIAVAGAVTTGQSRVHDRSWWAGRDAPAVRRLRGAGAVVVGKTTLSEHGLGRPDPATGLPIPRNPWDLGRWPGGSSSGSANGLAGGLFTAALGTDANGSLRIPAALCGVTALKPTYGLVPVDGVLPVSHSLDVVGPLARDVRDCLRVLRVLTARGPADEIAPAGRAAPAPWRDTLAGTRIGVPFAGLDASPELSADCRYAFGAAADELRALGAELVPIDLPEAAPLMAAQFVTLLVEAFELHAPLLRDRWKEFGRPFRRGVVAGGLIAGATYVRSQRVRRWAAERFLRLFEEVDVVATPTWPVTAPRYDDPGALAQLSGLPGLWSAIGFPAIAMPMGLGRDDLPLSLQLAGRPWGEQRLAVVADVYQRATGWHERRPAIGDHRAEPPPEPSAGPGGSADSAGEDHVRRTLAGHGLTTVDDDEVATLAVAWAALQAIPAQLPDLPTEVGPFGQVRLGPGVRF